MLCRIALGFSVPPSVVEGWSARDVDLVTRYFRKEPFGSIRDNFHAALIAVKVHNMLRGKHGKAAKLEDFMLVDREIHQKHSLGSFVQMMKSLGKRK